MSGGRFSSGLMMVLCAMSIARCAASPPPMVTSSGATAELEPEVFDIEEPEPQKRPALGPCEDGTSWPRMAEDLEINGQSEEATRLLRRCLGTVGGPPSTWRFLASLEEDRGEFEEARRTLLRAVASHPQDAFSWAALGRIEARRGQNLRALGAFERAHQLSPDNDALSRERTRAQARFGSPSAKRQARLVPLLTEADGRLELGDTVGALQTLAAASAVAEKDPISATIELRRALIYVQNGQATEAGHAVDRGLRLLETVDDKPRLKADLLVVRAEIALAGGQVQAAADAAGRARSLIPSHPLAAVNLGLARLQLGDNSAAARELALALELGLSKRLNRAAFLELPGVQTLLNNNAELRSKVASAWSQ